MTRLISSYHNRFRFMESEVELNDIIQEMHVIATVPELYHILVELNTVQSLLQLLTHDNTGILCVNNVPGQSHILAASRENLSAGFLTRSNTNQPAQLHLEALISHLGSRGVVLSK